MAVRASDKVTLAVLPAVSYVRPYYLLQASNLAVPAKPTTNPPASPWTISEPDFTMGSTDTLYTTMLIGYGDAYFEYGDVQKSSSYEAAKQAYNQAVNAASQAGQALTSANGKNTNWYQNDPPAGTDHKVHDCWFDLNDSNRMYRWNGTNWVSTQFGNNAFANIDAGKITTGTLAAARIAAQSITASKLALGDFTNLATNGDFTNGKSSWGGSSTVVTSATEPNYMLITTTSTGNNDQPNEHRFAVEAGEQFYVSFEVYGESTNTTWNSANVHLAITKTPSGTEWPSVSIPAASIQASPNTWLPVTGTITAPAGSRTAIVEPAVSGNGTAGNKYRFRKIIVRRKNTGELIVDGSILARHVEMNQGFADKFWANEGNFGKITTDFISSGFGNNLNISANESIQLIVSKQEDQDHTISTVESSVADTQNSANAAIGLASQAMTAATIADGKALVAQNQNADLLTRLNNQQAVFKVISTGAEISTIDGSSALTLTPTGIQIMQGGVAASTWSAGQMIVTEAVINRLRFSTNHIAENSGTRTVFRPLT